MQIFPMKINGSILIQMINYGQGKFADQSAQKYPTLRILADLNFWKYRMNIICKCLNHAIITSQFNHRACFSMPIKFRKANTTIAINNTPPKMPISNQRRVQRFKGFSWLYSKFKKGLSKSLRCYAKLRSFVTMILFGFNYCNFMFSTQKLAKLFYMVYIFKSQSKRYAGRAKTREMYTTVGQQKSCPVGRSLVDLIEYILTKWQPVIFISRSPSNHSFSQDSQNRGIANAIDPANFGQRHARLIFFNNCIFLFFSNFNKSLWACLNISYPERFSYSTTFNMEDFNYISIAKTALIRLTYQCLFCLRNRMTHLQKYITFSNNILYLPYKFSGAGV